MIGIAIINYNSYQKTIECVESIRQNTKIDYKIYLLDNASSNDSYRKLNDVYANNEDILLIKSTENLGYAKGNNLCIKLMIKDKCNYGIISNNDINIYSNSIEILISDLKKNPNLLLVGPKIQFPNGEYQNSVKLNTYKPFEYLMKSTYLKKFNKKGLMQEKNNILAINNLTHVEWISGAFFAFSVKNMLEIGGFDSSTFLFFEEYILSAKAKENNFIIAYEPHSLVLHDHSFSTGGGTNVIAKIAADKSEQYYLKNYSEYKKMFCRFILFVRNLETIYTFLKRKDLSSIKKYFYEMKIDDLHRRNEYEL